MLAWQKFGNGQTPESTGLKGDKLVGNYYVAFDKAYKEEIAQLMSTGKTEEEAKKQAPIILEAFEMGSWRCRSYCTLENHESMGL